MQLRWKIGQYEPQWVIDPIINLLTAIHTPNGINLNRGMGTSSKSMYELLTLALIVKLRSFSLSPRLGYLDTNLFSSSTKPRVLFLFQVSTWIESKSLLITSNQQSGIFDLCDPFTLPLRHFDRRRVI